MNKLESRRKQPDPIVSNVTLRENAGITKNYIAAVDATDRLFDEYSALVRQIKKMDGGSDARHEQAGIANEKKRLWEQAKANAATLQQELPPALQHVEFGRKQNRDAIRGRIETMEQVTEGESRTEIAPANAELANVEITVTQQPPEIPLITIEPASTPISEPVVVASAVPDSTLNSSLDVAPAARQRGPWLSRLAESRLARAVVFLGGLFGIKESHAAYEEHGTETAALRQEILDVATTSSFERLGEGNHMQAAPEIDPEKVSQLNEVYTQLVKEYNGPLSFMREQCAAEDSTPEQVVLDALKCNDFYGDQFRLSDAGLNVIAETYGYSAEEINLHGKLMRTGVITTENSGIGGYAKRYYYDYGSISSNIDIKNSRVALYDGYYETASALVFEAISEFDLTRRPPKEQALYASKISAAIRDEIRLNNVFTIVAMEVSHFSNDMLAKTLTESTTNISTGEVQASHIQQLEDLQLKAKASWEALSQLEPTDSSFHNLATIMPGIQEQRLQQVMVAGQTLYPDADFFQQSTNVIEDTGSYKGS